MNESTKILNFKFSPLMFLLILAVLLGGIYFASRSGSNSNEYRNDFNVYYFASLEIIEGRTPYDNSLGEWTPYLYPPLLAELLAAIAWLPLPVAAYLWFLINAFSLFAVLRISARLVCDENKELIASPGGDSFVKGRWNRLAAQQTLLPLITLLVLLRFVLDNFDYGQVNITVAALAVAHIYYYSKGKKIASAIVLVLAASIKLTPVIFLLYHIAKGRVKFAAGCVALMVAVSLLSFAPFGALAPEAFHTFVNRTIKNQQGFDFAYHGNQSLRAAIERIKGNTEARDPSSASTLIFALAFLALAFFAAFKIKSEIAAATPFFCLSVLLSPLSWKQHFVILMLPVAFLIGETLRQAESPVKRFTLATLAITFVLFNLTSPKIIGVAAAEWCDAHSLVFIGALIVFFASTAIFLPLWRNDFKSNS